MSVRQQLTVLPAVALAMLAFTASSVDAQATTTDGVYSSEQSSRGEDLFNVVCSECHLSEEFEGLVADWEGSSAFDLWEEIRTTMPEDGPGTLRNQEYADVLAYILSLNGAPAGDGELKGEGDALREIVLAAPPQQDR